MRFGVRQVHHASRMEYLGSSVRLEFRRPFQALNCDRAGGLVVGCRLAGGQHQTEAPPTKPN